MMRNVFCLLLFVYFSLGDPPCIDFAVNNCRGDQELEIEQFNTGDRTLCQQHCNLFSDCEFYTFHESGQQSVDCHLFREPVNDYLYHCNIRQGPRSGANTGNCFKPQEKSCQVEQKESCVPNGRIIESNLLVPDAETCQKVCDGISGCNLWQYSMEEKSCDLYDKAEKRCNIILGPPDKTPGECGSTTPPPPTQDPNQSTPQPGVCGITCPSTGLELFADCEHCGMYYECYNGVLRSQTCPNCYFFDEENQYCSQRSQVDCGDRPVDDNCEAPTNDGNCPFLWGYFQDPYDCDQYVVCSDGAADFYSCSNSTFPGLYDYKLEWCNFPDKVVCEGRPICRGPDHTQCQCQGAAVEGPDLCAGISVPSIRDDPFNCQHYVVCQGGAEVADGVCEDGEYYNPVISSCAPDPSVCGGRPVCDDKANGRGCSCP